MNIAIILAGGVGKRLGADIPKQFVEILGKPILAYTIEPFEKHQDVDAILVVCVKPYMGFVWELKKKYSFSKLKWVAEGGSTFQESVMNGIKYLSDIARPDDTVIFHFGASPFIKPDIITDVIKVCKEKGTNAISTTDYLLLSGKKKSTQSVSAPENYTEEYIDRDTIAVMNSPHAFRYGFIAEMYRKANKTGIINTVEPHTTTLMYAMREPIYFSRGYQGNIKITTREDLELFEGYVLAQQRRTGETVSGDVIVFLADGFEECEALLVVDILRRAGIKVVMASVMKKRTVVSSRAIVINADCLAENVKYSEAKMIVLPGGRLGTEKLAQSELVKRHCVDFATQKKHIAAICAAPRILANLGILDGKRATVHPDFENMMGNAILSKESVTVDGNIITGQGLGTSISFALKLVEVLNNKKASDMIAATICYIH